MRVSHLLPALAAAMARPGGQAGGARELWVAHRATASGARVDPSTFLSQAAATKLDVALLGRYGNSLEALMEAAGQGAALATAGAFPLSRVLVLVGPGNNGGDGIVAARWLATSLGHPRVALHSPRAVEKHASLTLAARAAGVAVLDTLPSDAEAVREYDVVLDALFGFSFRPPVRPEFEPALALLTRLSREAAALDAGGEPVGASSRLGLPVVCVDIPSGWDVEAGDVSGRGVLPALLVSLSWPKRCASTTRAAHVLAGRFIPQALAEELGLGDELAKVWPPGSTHLVATLEIEEQTETASCPARARGEHAAAP
jgi:NAD(P)H-hydrate epimerase